MSSITTNLMIMLLLLLMLKLSLWWQQYNDNANGWYLLTKLLPSSYISTFCVVIVCFTDMISKYTLFQAFYSLLIFFARDNLHSVSALQSTLWAMVKWTYRVLCMSIFTWFTEYSVKHPKIDYSLSLFYHSSQSTL